MRATRLLSLFAATMLPLAATPSDTPLDDRIGIATHFGNTGHYIENWDIQKLIPKVVELGAGWIRDDFYWGHYETKKGVYEIPARAREWIDTAHAAGLKIVLVFNGANKLYDDPYDPLAYAAAAAHLAR
jgi:hypothetical protein